MKSVEPKETQFPDMLLRLYSDAWKKQRHEYVFGPLPEPTEADRIRWRHEARMWERCERPSLVGAEVVDDKDGVTYLLTDGRTVRHEVWGCDYEEKWEARS